MLNTVFFILTKMVTESMAKTFGNFMPPPSPSSSQQNQRPPPTTRMRGPNSDDLADILGQTSPTSTGVLPETLRRRNVTIPSSSGARPEMKKNN
jgi:hypothetical protein